MPLTGKCDIGIFTILDLELDAIKKILGLNETERKDGIVYHTGRISAGDATFNVVCCQPSDYSNLPAESTTEKLIQHWDPKFVVAVGIAGGVKDRENLQLGDVVIPTDVFYTEVEKKSDGQKLSRPLPKSPPAPEFRDSHQVARTTTWTNRITVRDPEGKNNSKVVYGQILSGEKLEGDPEDQGLKEKLDAYDKFIAVEMESGGVSRAVYEQSRWHSTKFFVVRGISDYCNVKKNKETRNNWGQYAAESAAAYSLALIENLQIYENPSKSYVADFDQRFDALPETPFVLSVLDVDENIGLDDVVSVATSKQKIILSGRPGIGKSFAINKMSRQIREQGGIPVVLNLKKWDNEFLEKISSSETSIEEKMNVLLAMSKISLNEKFLRNIEDQKFFIVDGLNEISSGEFGGTAVRKILITVEEYVRNHALNSPIIVTDRIPNRGFTDSYHSIRLEPMMDAEVKKIIDEKFQDAKYDSLNKKTKTLLSIPYFLDQALKSNNPELLTETKTIENFFKKHVGLGEDEVNKVSETIFQMSGTKGTLKFNAEQLEQSLGSDIYQNLIQTETLTTSPDETVQFQHQLQQEYLISRFLSLNQDKWNVLGFDASTLRANSIETLFMTIEQLSDKADVDKFLMSVFDWNWPAAVKCIGVLESGETENYSQPTIIAITALVAQKMFDPIHGTARYAGVLLSEIKNDLCKKMRESKSFDEIVSAVNSAAYSEDWFLRWREIFVMENTKIPNDSEILSIKSSESLIGWTASNVFKALKLSDVNQGQLRMVYHSLLEDEQEKNTVRWRIVHTLGSFPSSNNRDLLFSALKDPYHWTRYGAARSLMEMAAKTECPELRKSIISHIESNFKEMESVVREEIGKASMYHDASGDWEISIRPLLEEIGDFLDEELTKREWEKIMKRFNEGLWKK